MIKITSIRCFILNLVLSLHNIKNLNFLWFYDKSDYK